MSALIAEPPRNSGAEDVLKSTGGAVRVPDVDGQGQQRARAVLQQLS